MAKSSMIARVLAVVGLLVTPLAGLPAAVSAAVVHEGDFDPNFAQDGRARASFVSDGNDEAHAVALAPDGKIVVAGLSFNAVTGGYDMGIVRYNADGTFDTTFNHGGLKGVNFGPSTSAEGHAVVVQPDGKIVVAGSVFASGGSTTSFAIARLTTSGALDTTFGTGGRKVFQPSDAGISGMALQPDGKIVVVGSTRPASHAQVTVVRLKPSGALDGTFGSGGTVTLAPLTAGGDFPNAVLVQPDGKLLVGGFSALICSSGCTFQMAALLIRLGPGGGLDPTWGSGGVTLTDISTDDSEIVNALALATNGDVFAGGSKSPAGVTTHGGLLLRYTSGGLLKPSTASGDPGWVAASGFDQVPALVRQRDGKLVVIGTTVNGSSFEVARYTRDFLLDPHFAGDGEETVPFGAHGFDNAYAGAVQRDGKIVVVGRTWTGVFDAKAGGDIYNYAVARLIGDATRPTGQRVAGLPTYSRSRTLHPTWRASDDNTGVRSYDVRTRSAAASRTSYGAWHLIRSATTKRTTTFTAKAGRTYCFEVRARDYAGNVGAWSVPRCTAVPVDDRALTAHGAWVAGGGSGDYLRTVRSSSHAGDTLTGPVAFRRLALLVRTCPGCGKVRVVLSGKRLGTFDLHATRTHRRVLVPVVNGTTIRSGPLKLVQVSGGHPVVVDGVAVSLA